MMLPTVDFLGIGAQKAGTTWLYRCLQRHPQLYLPGTKELHYFDRLTGRGPQFTQVRSLWSGLVGQGAAEREWRQRVGWTMQKIVRGGLSAANGREVMRAASFHLPGPKDDAWYRRQFDAAAGRLRGEITPAYALLDDAGVRHVTRLSPDVKVILILREPLSRMFSQWRMKSLESRGLGLPSPTDPIKFFASDRVNALNDYLRTLDTWEAHVPQERFFIGWYDDILADPEGMLRRVLTFLGVDPAEPRALAEARSRGHQSVGDKAVIPPEVLREMAQASRPGIAALAERFGGHAIGWLDRCDTILAGEDGGGHGNVRHHSAARETATLHDPVVDAAEEAFRFDPYPTFKQWLAKPGAFHSPAHGAWIVSRHDQVSALFRDPLVTNRTEKAGVLGDTMLAHDPPDHGRLRSLVADAFGGAGVRALESRISALTDEQIDGVAGLSQFDFVEHFADRIPGRVMMGLLGLPIADLPMLRACADMAGGPEVSARNMALLSEYFAGIMRERESCPGEDLVTSLVAAQAQGGRASMTEVLATCVLLLLAGYETTSSLLGNGMLLLLRHPDQYARLRENPDLVGPAVEEMLRFESPTHFPSARAAKEPMEIGGQSIAAGDRILACLGAANRDPSVFPDPDRFDIGRTPNPHLAFGMGIHGCPGALLSRTEARIVFTRINARLGELRLDVSDPRTFQPSWRRNERVRGLTSLPVRR